MIYKASGFIFLVEAEIIIDFEVIILIVPIGRL